MCMKLYCDCFASNYIIIIYEIKYIVVIYVVVKIVIILINFKKV